MPSELIEPLSQFGVAGLMGALWVWERLLSRKREQQLTESHERLVSAQTQVSVLVELVRRHTEAVEHLRASHDRLGALIKELADASHKMAA